MQSQEVRQQEIQKMEEQLKLAGSNQVEDTRNWLATVDNDEVPISRFVTSASDIQRVDPIRYMQIQRQIMKKFVQGELIDGVDFGVIPGTDKPGLYKPGAEKLATLFGFRIQVRQQEGIENYEKPLFAYNYKAIIYNNRNEPLCECEANCNSYETKYRYRNVKAAWATEQEKAAQVGTKRFKKNGQWEEYLIVPNSEIYSQVNTIKKMAQKRAIVGAVILAVNASGFFGNMEAELSHESETGNHPTWDIDVETVIQSKQDNLAGKIIKQVADLISISDISTIKSKITLVGKTKSEELNHEELKAVIRLLLIDWAMDQNVFNHKKHAENSYDKLAKEANLSTPESLIEMTELFMLHVADKIQERTVDNLVAEQITTSKTV